MFSFNYQENYPARRQNQSESVRIKKHDFTLKQKIPAPLAPTTNPYRCLPAAPEAFVYQASPEWLPLKDSNLEQQSQKPVLARSCP
jgi:hypothetical protein